MLFRRRVPQTFRARVRTLLWPQRSWSRSLSYLKKRVLRLNATPHAIAAGFAAGIFATFTPFLGFHFLLAFAISYCIAGNMAAAALGCIAGNPVTFPAIWASTYEVGRFLLGSEAAGTLSEHRLGNALLHMDFAAVWDPILKPMLVGSVPIGLGFGAAAYAAVYFAALGFQNRRAKRLGDKRKPIPFAGGVGGT